MRDAVLRAASSSSMAACTPHPLRRVCREGGFVPFSSLLPAACPGAASSAAFLRDALETTMGAAALVVLLVVAVFWGLSSMTGFLPRFFFETPPLSPCANSAADGF